MSKTKYIKLQTKQLLKGNMPVLIAGLIILLIAAAGIISVFGLLSVISEEISYEPLEDIFYWLYFLIIWGLFVLTMPLWLGYQRACYLTAQGEKTSLSEMLRYVSGKEEYKKALRLGYSIIWRRLLWFCILSIPADIIIAAVQSSGASEDLYLGLYVFLYIIVFLLSILPTAKYRFTAYLFFDNEQLSSQEAMEASKQIYAQARVQLSLNRLIFSFFPWYLLLFFILPILYVAPYVTVCVSNYAKWCIVSFMPDNKTAQSVFEQNTFLDGAIDNPQD